MISGILIAIVIIGIAGWAVSKRKDLVIKGDPEEREDRANWKLITPMIVTFVIGMIISSIQPFVYARVDAGYVGVKVNLTGHDRGVSDIEYTTGWVLYNSWTEQLHEFPTYQQHIEYDETQVILRGGFVTYIEPTFNYALKPDMVADMFGQLRRPISEIEHGWLKTAIITSVNDVSNRWEVDSIFNHREAFEMEIIAECNKRVGDWFTISQLRTNIEPPKALRASIEAKTKAIQEAQAKIQEVDVAKANGERLIAEARADSARRVIEAQGIARSRLIEAESEAEAIKIKQREVSSIYNDYIRATKWDGKYPSTVAGSNAGIILDAR